MSVHCGVQNRHSSIGVRVLQRDLDNPEEPLGHSSLSKILNWSCRHKNRSANAGSMTAETNWPGTPAGPRGPVAPVNPRRPFRIGDPAGAAAAGEPRGPFGPVGPIGPLGPRGPGKPDGPVAPVRPFGPDYNAAFIVIIMTTSSEATHVCYIHCESKKHPCEL